MLFIGASIIYNSLQIVVMGSCGDNLKVTEISMSSFAGD